MNNLKEDNNINHQLYKFIINNEGNFIMVKKSIQYDI